MDTSTNNATTRLTPDQLLKHATFQEQYLSKNIQLADAKAGITVVAVSGLLTYLLGNRDFRTDITDFTLSADSIVALSSTILLGLSVVVAFWVLIPRLGSSPQSEVFWGHVSSELDSKQHWERLSGLTLENLALERISHCFDLSRVCARKFNRVTVSILLAGLGFALALAWLLIL